VETALEKIRSENFKRSFSVVRHGVEATDGLGDESFDAVVPALVFSEPAADERHPALGHPGAPRLT